MDEMLRVKQLAAMAALNSMLSKGYLDICTIDKIAEMINMNCKCEAYTILRTLHCVDFAKMPRELRQSIPSLIKQCLGMEPIFQYTEDDMGFSDKLKRWLVAQ